MSVIRPDEVDYVTHPDDNGTYTSKYTKSSQNLPSYDKAYTSADVPFEKPSWHKTEKIISPIRSESEDLEQYKTPDKRQNVIERSKENRRSIQEFSHSDLKSYGNRKDFQAVHTGYSTTVLPSHTGYSTSDLPSHTGHSTSDLPVCSSYSFQSREYRSDTRQGERISPRMNYEMGESSHYRTAPTDSSHSISHGMKQWQQKLDQQKRDTQVLL